MKRILINAEQPNEVRVAYLEDNKLVDFEIESSSQTSVKGNIYVGVVTAVKTDLEGAFVDIGEERHGLLAFSKAGGRGSRETRTQPTDEPVEIEHPDLQVGQKVLVQVFREARGEKGSALSMELSLPGRFIVLKPNSNVRAVTRNVSEVQRMRLRELGNQLPNVENVGWIMRTTAVNHTLEEITSDFHRLMNLWRNIQRAYEDNQQRAPVLVFSDNTLMQRVLRDRLRRDGTKVIVDDPTLYRESRSYASDFMPELRDQIEHYRGDRPIFDTFRVENAVASLFSRKVTLPSGGELVFDPTEALLSIDVNSAKNTGGETLEETALHTNLEAAEEICRQLMIRNIGGLVVVDFIDMLTEGYNEQVEKVVRECLAKDTANSECSAISEFGLMQLNRQRRRSSIYDTHFEECESCQGGRFVRRTETNANQVLRKLSYLIHDPTRQENQYLCRVPDDVAAYILNKERQYLRDLELNTRKQVIVIADTGLTNGTFDIKARRIKGIDYEGGSNLEELLHQSRQDFNTKDRVEYPEEPRVNPQPLVSPVVDKKSKKKKQKSNSKVAAHGKKKQQKGNKHTPNKSAVSRFFSALFGAEENVVKKNKKSASANRKREPSKSRRRTASTPKAQERKTTTSDRSHSGRKKSDPRVKGKSAKREEKNQRVSDQSNSPVRAPKREKTPRRERNTRSSTASNAANSKKTKAPSDNVRSAADLKQSTDEGTRQERKNQESTTPNRRAPRSSRTVGSNARSSAQRQPKREQPDSRGGRAENPRGRESDQELPTQSQSARIEQEPAASRQQSDSVRKREPAKQNRSQATNDYSGRDRPIEKEQDVTPDRIEAEQKSEREIPTPDVPNTSERLFAANDPRARVETRGLDSQPAVKRVEAAVPSSGEKASDDETRAHQPIDAPESPQSSPPVLPPKAEVEQGAETSTVQRPSVDEESSGESGRASNDPRSRISSDA